MLPMVVRRLDAEERKMIKSGDVHVWEERGPGTEATGLGIERYVVESNCYLLITAPINGLTISCSIDGLMDDYGVHLAFVMYV